MLFGGMGNSRRSSSSGGGAAQLIIIAVAVILVILAPIFAQLIYFAISRKREYLADACSALYTRYPEALASALEKIGSSTQQLKSANKATAPMYIINPFRKQGMAASDLSSTHPPISERIRILRSMSGVSYSDYNKAYQQIHKSKGGIIPTSEAAPAGIVALRTSGSEAGQKESVQEQVQRTRETSNTLWNLNNYRTIDCDCGVRLRIPQGFKDDTVKCPHCGRIHSVS